MTGNTPSKYVGTVAAAVILGCHRVDVWRLGHDGVLPRLDLEARTDVFLRADVEALRDARAAKAAARLKRAS
jgi:hypothetical protein